MRRAPFLGLELLRRGLAPRAASAAFGPWMVRRYLRYHTPGLKSREEITEFAAPLASADGRRAFWHICREGLAPSRAGDLAPMLGEIDVPVLLIWARNDTLIPLATGARWRDALPGSELAVVDDSSHFVQVDQPAATSRLLTAFLARGRVQPSAGSSAG